MSVLANNAFSVLARRGMRDMLVRQIFATAISFGGSVILARVLNPSDFGTYAIATFVVNVFMVLGDLGLGASFIQNSKSPDDKYFQISFTIQMALITTVVLVTWFLAPWIIGFYSSISRTTMWLIRAMSFLLYLPVLRSASTIQLERTLRYRPIAWSEGVGMSLYQVVAVIGALKGLGVWSFVFATLLSGLTSLIIVYRSAPWRVGFCFDWSEIKPVLRKSISFQSAVLLDVISQWAIPAIAGTLAGPSAVGYLGLALANARRPLLVAESVMRVSFPLFSRLQENVATLQQTISNYLVILLWVMFGWTGLMWGIASPLVMFVYSAKWLPAVPALLIFAVALPMDITIWTVGLSYRALNRNWCAVKIFSVRTATNLGLSALLVPHVGFVGSAAAYVIANTICSILLLYNFAPGFFSRIMRNSAWVLPCAVLASLCGRLCSEFGSRGGSGLAVQGLVAGAVPFAITYLLCSFALAPIAYRAEFLSFVRRFFSMENGFFNMRSRAANFEYVASED